jgi:hypothetical protein
MLQLQNIKMVNSSRALKRKAFSIFGDIQHFGNFTVIHKKIPAKAWVLLNREEENRKKCFLLLKVKILKICRLLKGDFTRKEGFQLSISERKKNY